MYKNIFEKNNINKNQTFIIAVVSVVLALLTISLPTGFSPYILPFPAYVILIAIFTNPRVAFVSSMLMLCVLTLGMHYDIEFMTSFTLLNIVASIFMAQVNFTRRVDLIRSGLYIACAGAMFVASIYMLEKFLIDIENVVIARYALFVFINGVISSMVVLGVFNVVFDFDDSAELGFAGLESCASLESEIFCACCFGSDSCVLVKGVWEIFGSLMTGLI